MTGKNFRLQALILAAFAVFCLAFVDSSQGQRLPRFCRALTARTVFVVSGNKRDLPAAERHRKVVFLTNKKTVQPGGRIYARLVNFGRSIVGYGREFAIERWTSTDWELDPSSPKGPWPRVLGRINPGSAGKCYRFDVPSEQEKGFYRFSTKASIRLVRHQMRKTAKFTVT
jgi:hypothetical protein